jgi:hypothetical protein
VRLDQIPPNPPQPVFQEPRYLRPGREQVRLALHCPACGAKPGERCDDGKVSTFEGIHFARDEGFEWPPRSL